MRTIGPDDEIPDAIVEIPAEPDGWFGGDFAYLARFTPLGPHPKSVPFVARDPATSRPPSTPVTPAPVKTRLWTDDEGRQWQIMDAYRVASGHGPGKHRSYLLGDPRAEVRAFVPYGWTGDALLLEFSDGEYRGFDDDHLRRQFKHLHAIEAVIDLHRPDETDRA